jgi:hypothetical protein
MCKSVETSLATYAVSLSCIGICWYLYGSDQSAKGVRFASIFIATFASMQLLDAGLWWSINNRNKALNHAITRYAIPALLAVVLSVSYLSARFIFGWRNAYYELGLAVFVTFILLGWWFKYCPGSVASYTAPHPSDGYLHWCGIDLNTLVRTLFCAFLFAPIVLGLPASETVIKYVIIIPILATFLFNFDKVTFGSRWCWSANITALALLAYVIYLKFKPI